MKLGTATSLLRWMSIIKDLLLKVVLMALVICGLAVVLLIGPSKEQDQEE